jgi:hypothetical protein
MDIACAVIELAREVSVEALVMVDASRRKVPEAGRNSESEERYPEDILICQVNAKPALVPQPAARGTCARKLGHGRGFNYRLYNRPGFALAGETRGYRSYRGCRYILNLRLGNQGSHSRDSGIHTLAALGKHDTA